MRLTVLLQRGVSCRAVRVLRSNRCEDVLLIKVEIGSKPGNKDHQSGSGVHRSVEQHGPPGRDRMKMHRLLSFLTRTAALETQHILPSEPTQPAPNATLFRPVVFVRPERVC